MSRHLSVGPTAATHQRRYWLVAKDDHGGLKTQEEALATWGDEVFGSTKKKK